MTGPTSPDQVVLVPGVPALLSEYAGLDDPVAELRAACLDAVAWLGPDVRVLASAQGARVAASLLRSVGSRSVPPGDLATVPVLVVGNGTATRSEKAPGHLDERAHGYDDVLRSALIRPDPVAFAAIDRALGVELWADVDDLAGLGEILTPDHVAEVGYDAAPFGVQYWVMRWSRGARA